MVRNEIQPLADSDNVCDSPAKTKEKDLKVAAT